MEDSSPVEVATPPRSPHSGNREFESIITMQSISPLDKVRQFFEEQEVQREAVVSGTNATTAPLLDAEPSAEQQSVNTFLSGDLGATRRTPPPVEKPQRRAKRRRDAAPDGLIKKESKGREKRDLKSIALFRESQKILRREAKHANIKEALCRSLPHPGDVHSERRNLFGPSGASQVSSTWSSTVAADITNRFLSNVQQRKKETFERLLQREMTNSQLSFTSTGDGDGSLGGAMGELVIGDESAIMTPLHSDTIFSFGDGTTAEPTTETVASASSTQDPLMSCSGVSQGFIELDEETVQAQSDALMRKHELWRLRQRQLRVQRAEEESNSQAKTEKDRCPFSSRQQTSSCPLAYTTPAVTTQKLPAHEADGGVDNVVTHRSALKRTMTATLDLTTDHIDMIRRANSFDNISNQRIVVFETKKGEVKR